jgi:hypothetical protein
MRWREARLWSACQSNAARQALPSSESLAQLGAGAGGGCGSPDHLLASLPCR